MIEALLKTVRIFNKHKIKYCLIGGLAVLLHGGRATTVDIDFYVLVGDLKDLIKTFKSERIHSRPSGNYQVKAKVDNVSIDCLYADHYVGKEVLTRAVEKKLGSQFIRVATPEDLIVLKTLADRSIDRRDIEELRELFGKKLDEKYIEKKLRQLKNGLKES